MNAYPMQFVITMESGAVALVSLKSENRDAGKGAAVKLALTTRPGDAYWDAAAYPLDGSRAFAEGVQMIKAAPRKPAL